MNRKFISIIMVMVFFAFSANAQVNDVVQKNYKGDTPAPNVTAKIVNYNTDGPKVVYTPADSPAASAYSSNTYDELGWTDITVSETDAISVVTVAYTWATDAWPSEGSFHLESPSGTSVVIASGETSGTYSHDIADFSGEAMNGDWKLWIEDSFDDGGHQATSITVTLNAIVDHDLAVTSVSPSGTISTGSTFTPTVTIHNWGTNDESTYDVQLVSDPAGYDFTVSDVAIAAGETLVLDGFDDWSPADGTYDLTATVTLSGDANPTNDVYTSTIEVRGLGFGDIIWAVEAPDAACPGIETDGTNIYVAYWRDSDPHPFAKFDMYATFIEYVDVAGVAAVRDMAYNPNTGFFYGAAANTSLFELDLASATLENTITIPTASRAILYDDDDDTFWANDWDTPFTEFDMSGTATGNSITVTSQYGAAYDNWTDPANPTIWGFTSTGGTPANTLVEYAMDGTLTGRSIDVSTIPGFNAGIAGGLASYEEDGIAYLLVNIQQDPNLIAKIVLFVPEVETYSVTFTVDDGALPLEDVNIAINGEDLTTGADGVAFIEGLQNGTYDYTATLANYETYSSTVTVTDGDEDVAFSMVLIESINGINSNISIFPNPSTGEFTITVANNYLLEVMDLSGKLVYTQELTQAQTDINLTEQEAGVYLIRLTNSDRTLNYKIVIE